MSASTGATTGARTRGEERRFLTVCAVVLAVALLVTGADTYVLTIGISAAIWYLVVTALNVVVGYSGQFSAGHAALFGIGAYAAALANVRWGLPPALTIVPAVVVAGLLSMALSFPLNRLRGPFLAMATFALQLAFTELLLRSGDLTGGANGMVSGILTWDGQPLAAYPLFVLMALTGTVVTVLLFNLLRLRTGRALRAISADETMAETLGIRIARARSLAFTLSGCIAGLAGFWQLQYFGYIDPTLFDLPASIAFLAVLVVGGRGSLAGPLCGVVFYYVSHTLLASLATLEALLYGGLVVLAVMFAPAGIAGLLAPATRWVAGRTWRRHATADSVSIPDLGEARLSPLPSTGWGDPSATTAEQTPATPAPVLELDAVAKSYGGVHVLSDVSFAIPPGTVAGLIGPNGAGKTTMLNIVNGLSDYDDGVVTVGGVPLTRRADPFASAGLGIGRTFQVPRLVDTLPVTENVMLGHHRHTRGSFAQDLLGLPVSRREDRRVRRLSEDVLGSFGLSGIADVPVARLSHGMRRFVEIARAVVGNPRLLLLDEPGAGLEPVEIDYLGELLRHLNRELGLAMLVVDHNMRLVMGSSSHVVVLHSGTVIKAGAPDEVRADSRVIDAYLGTTAGK